MVAAIILGIWLVMAVAVLAIGVTPLRISDTGRATIGEGVSHGLGWITLCFGVWPAMPLVKGVFSDFGVELPTLSQWFIQISHAALFYWYLVLPSLAFALALDVMIFRSLHHAKKTRLAAKAFSASITAVLLLAILASMLGAAMPLISLWIELS